jgi:hypothetical protein
MHKLHWPHVLPKTMSWGFNMKHIIHHLYNSIVCMLYHPILLRCIFDSRCYNISKNGWTPRKQTPHRYSIETPWFCALIVSSRVPWTLWTSQNTPFLNLNTYKHTFFEKWSMKVTTYLALPIDVVLMGPHMLEWTIPKDLVTCNVPLIWKCDPMLLVFFACIAKQWVLSHINFAKVPVTHHILKCLNNLCV